MSYNENGLQAFHNCSHPTGGTRGPTYYSYTTNDTAATVVADGYFDGALNNGLRAGDIIFANLDMDGTPDFKIYRITAGGADVAIVADHADA